jgi:hypothetical protein
MRVTRFIVDQGPPRWEKYHACIPGATTRVLGHLIAPDGDFVGELDIACIQDPTLDGEATTSAARAWEDGAVLFIRDPMPVLVIGTEILHGPIIREALARHGVTV